MGKFVISRRFTGEYQFNLKAMNGQIILSSEAYSTKEGCYKGIDSVKENSKNNSRFERKSSINGKYYFILKAASGEIIGISQLYESEIGMENGIESVIINAPFAEVEEFVS